jgi:hypothetical protein
MPRPAHSQVSGPAELSASDCHYPWLSASSGTQRARDLRRFLVAPGVAPDRRQRDALVLAVISRPVSGNPAAPCPVQAPPPNPIAAEPYGRRVLSRGGAADHE